MKVGNSSNISQIIIYRFQYLLWNNIFFENQTNSVRENWKYIHKIFGTSYHIPDIKSMLRPLRTQTWETEKDGSRSNFPSVARQLSSLLKYDENWKNVNMNIFSVSVSRF